MHAETYKPESRNDLNLSTSQSQHQVILGLLRENLPKFVNEFVATPDPEFACDIEKENYISGEVVIYLTNHVNDSGYIFSFRAEGPDILVHSFGCRPKSVPLLAAEAKRLRAKSSRDYVSSGIQRFKDERHGKGDNVAAMLGYVQENDFDHWYRKVNGWIDDRVSKGENNWKSSDRLDEVRVKSMGEYESKHSRISGVSITLHHFWLDFTGKKL